MLPQLEQRYAKAAQDFPDSTAANSSYGYLLVRENKLPEALSQFQVSDQLMPTDRTAHRNRALGYKSLGMTDKAVASERDALALVPSEQTED